jgi:predicted chitinase
MSGTNSRIIKAEESDFKISDSGFYLDGRLIAILDGSQRDFMGREIFTTGFFRENIGFGIININIEVNTSLQPIVTITLKDLYGNAVFGKNVIDEEVPDYSVLFNWPPPKFLFTFKGYLGRQVSWVLNLKQTSTSYQADGSYEIKCEFIPSQWGFMGDLPFLFLLAIKGLKKNELPPESFKKQQTVFDLIKIGLRTETKTKEITKEFDELLEQMNLIKSNRIVEALVYSKLIKLDQPIDGAAGNSKVVSTTEANGTINFSNVTFPTPSEEEIKTIEKIKEYTSSNVEALRKVNAYFLLNATIGSTPGKGVSLKSVNFTSGSYEQEEMRFRIKFIDDNLKVIDAAIKKRVYDSSKSQLAKITIGQIFRQLGRDSGYIMGKILEAGAVGYDNNKTNRDIAVKEKTTIGKQFPLKIDSETGNEVPALGSGVDIENNELNFVDKFITAVSQGVAQDLLREDQLGGLSDNTKLLRRVNNIEAPNENPYKPFFRNIAQNIMVRSGIIAFLTRSNDPNFPGDYDTFWKIDRESIEEVLRLASSDMDNLTVDMLNEIENDEYILLKQFCYYWTNLISSDGTLLLNDDGTNGPDFAGVGFNVAVPEEITSKRVRVDKSDDTIRLDINDIYDLTFGRRVIAEGDNVGYDKSNAGFINKKTMQAQAVLNNNILYRVPMTNQNKFTFVFFQNSNSVKALKANNAVSDNEAKNEDPDDTSFFTGKKPLIGIVPINSYYPSTQGADSEANNLEPLGRITFLQDMAQDKLKYPTVKYSEINNPSPALYSPDGTNWENSVLYPTASKIVDPNSDINSKLQIPASNLAVAVAMAPLSADMGLVFGPFLNSTSGRNHRASIKMMCSIILNNMSKLEQTRNEIISDVLGKATESRDTIYKQFHTLYHQWEALLFDDSKYDSGNIVFPLIPIEKIVQTLEDRYGSEDVADNSRHYSTNGKSSKKSQIEDLDTNVFVYDYPLNNKADIDVRKSIINIEPLYRPDGNTTVLNMFQQVCTKNNFTFIPIPGNGNFNDYLEIFKPHIEGKVRLQNIFYVMFTPTPESRAKAINSSKSLLSESEDYSVNPNQDAYEVKVGSPDNKIFTNFSVDTYETKATAESIISTQRATDNDNPSKKVATDCSQLPVMEGRSYKASFEMIGNAQVFPFQYFYLNAIPMFNGIYQVTNVKHSITPNDMKTTAEGIRMRFSAGELAGIQPITLDSLANINVVEQTVDASNLTERPLFAEDDFDPSITRGIDETGGNKGSGKNYSTSSSRPSYNQTQKNNINSLIKQMNDAGIFNPFAKAAILAVISKECGFIPQTENLNYSPERMRVVWPSTSVADSKKYGNNPEAFGNWKYGNKYGNGSKDGYKYRGRGFNQITFKSAYEKYGNAIGVNLIADPNKLNDPKYAGLAAIAYFKIGLKSLSDSKSAYYDNPSKTFNTFKTLEDAVGAIYHTNAGVGKSISKVLADTTGGRQKAFAVSGYMLEIVKAGRI